MNMLSIVCVINLGIIKIEGADLSTSTLMFHAFHDILAVTDNQGVGIWSLESGNQVFLLLIL